MFSARNCTDAEELVLKSQIHAGGRGKGHFNTGFKGGVKVCTGPNRFAISRSRTLWPLTCWLLV